VRVTLLETEGRGRAAEIELAGHRLRVVDRISPADRPSPRGPVSRPKLEVVTIPALTSRLPGDTRSANELAPDHGWRYRARGTIVSTGPLVADLGMLRLELTDLNADEWNVGDRLSLAIDRIILTRQRPRQKGDAPCE